MPDLANRVDLELRIQRELSGDEADRADQLLRDASSAVVRISGQQILRSTEPERVAVRNGRARLSQLPIHDVTGVRSVGTTLSPAADLAFDWDGGQMVVVDMAAVYGDFEYNPIVSLGGSKRMVDVTYDHGYDVVPDWIVATVCNTAIRALGVPLESTGLQQETIGGYAYSIGSAAAQGPMGFLAQELAGIQALRQPVRPARMA